MNRKNVVHALIGVSMSLGVSQTVLAQKDIEEQVKEEVSEIVSQEKPKKLQKTLENIGQTEFDTFRSFFGIKSDAEMLEKIDFLQKNYGGNDKKNQGIIDASLLKKIYIDFYSKTIETLPPDIQKRWLVYQEMQGYSKKSGALYARLDVFSQNDYFGKGVGMHKTGTLINENLFGNIPEVLDTNENKIIVSKKDDKKILAFYVAGKLYLATYVSPGALGHQTPKLKIKGKNKPDKYHTSSEYPEAEKKKSGIKGGAVMPYAVHIDGGVWFHGSDGKIDGKPQSHGCVRTPLFYIKEIYEKVSILGIENVSIDTTGIY